MPFSWHSLRRPIVCLAPMAGVTDASYRQLIKTLAPGVVVYSEFLSTDALAYRGKKTTQMMEFDPALERPYIVQIFGKKPEHFLEAAKVVEQMGADGIDINMGCPAAKVVSSAHGAALLKNPDLAAELVASAVKAVSIPVSVKTRLGWDTAPFDYAQGALSDERRRGVERAETLIPFCTMMVEAGAAALAVHGRRYIDKFAGTADWAPIYELKKRVTVPVIGNGDIRSGADAVAKLGNLDGVMVGRATFGNPWVMKEVWDSLNAPTLEGGGEHVVSSSLSIAQKIPFILEHCRLAVRLKGEERGMREMRRHLASYVKGFPGAAEMRARLVRVESVREVEEILAGVDG